MDYEEHKNLIFMRAKSWYNTSGLDWEECISIANLGFAEAVRNYDENKGAFTTYLWKGINVQFKVFLVNHHSKWRKSIDLREHYEDLKHTNKDSFHFIEKIQDLSGRAQGIIMYILENPDEFCSNGKIVTNSHARLAGRIAKRGYSWRTARQIIKEIKKALQED